MITNVLLIAVLGFAGVWIASAASTLAERRRRKWCNIARERRLRNEARLSEYWVTASSDRVSQS